MAKTWLLRKEQFVDRISIRQAQLRAKVCLLRKERSTHEFSHVAGATQDDGVVGEEVTTSL